MPELTEKNNLSTEEDLQPMEREEAEELLRKLEGWQLSADGKKISRNLKLKDFREAVDFIISLANFAEKIGHYPDTIVLRYNKVAVELTTRRAKGLSEKDFILAAEVDAIAGWKNKLEQWLISPKVLISLVIILLLIVLWQRLS